MVENVRVVVNLAIRIYQMVVLEKNWIKVEIVIYGIQDEVVKNHVNRKVNYRKVS